MVTVTIKDTHSICMILQSPSSKRMQEEEVGRGGGQQFQNSCPIQYRCLFACLPALVWFQ